MTDLRQLHWAAGFLEGEGSFTCCRAIRIDGPQKQLEPLLRLQKLFGGTIGAPSSDGVYRWRLNGRNAAGVMMTLWPLMSPRRQEQIEKSLAKWRLQPNDGGGGRVKGSRWNPETRAFEIPAHA